MVSAPSKPEERFVHDGVRRAAQSKRENALPHAVAALKENTGYSLILTGHSLGAGTVAVLAGKELCVVRGCVLGVSDQTLRLAMLNLDNNGESDGIPRDTVVQCYAFAVPCVFSYNVSCGPLCKNILSVSVGDDW